MSTVHNPNNWHWVERNCVPWAKEYFEENLTKISIPANDSTISVKSIKSFTGDCDVTQRKGKVKCLFELKIEFVLNVVTGEEEEEITVILPEFEHDYDESDFNFEIQTSKLPHKAIVRKEFLPVAIERVFLKFQPDLLAANEVNLKHNTD
jgi:activator of HSP90 ATPase